VWPSIRDFHNMVDGSSFDELMVVDIFEPQYAD
jgi:hypothetical protein